MPFLHPFLITILLLLLGFCIGVLSGFFGVGGAFILTPILNILGLPMPSAVASGLAFTVAVSSLGGVKHYQQGHVSLPVVLIVGLLSLLGVRLSPPLVFYLDKLGMADTAIRIVYIFLLFLLGLLTLKKGGAVGAGKTTKKKGLMYAFNNLPPVIQITMDSRISFWMLLFISLLVGFLKGFLGVGGGFVLVPLFILLLKMESHIAAGTSLLVLLISSVYASYLYLGASLINFQVVFLLVPGTLLGVYLGTKDNDNISTRGLQLFYGIFLLFSAMGILFKQISLTRFSLLYSLLLTAVVVSIILYRYRRKPFQQEGPPRKRSLF